ncbi:PREDICTED: uncharacterized protein LOC109304334 isoform X2 [Gavialis gangeticus]|uniref:uncharacterized protein LOC109304334 isoform X2 n=1 Tax=Gavialis gangeticus TaxID=94835 RepID=UPI00092EF42B|nr:PREDICTED: uncharacterized protein LOC109304334 isoform X2 [Gavialis gangeticus]
MSGSTVRKVQPFTISTKLSLPKCAADCPGDPCPDVTMAALDNRSLRHNLNERVSLYLAQTQAAPGPPEGRVQSTSPMEEGVTDEDRLNRNSLARSIKKITLSNWHGEPGPGEDGVAGDPAHASCQRNHNNNNSRPGKAPFKLSGSHAAAPWKESIKTKEPGGMAWLKTGLRNSTGQANPNLSPLLAQFNQEIMQAESWVRGKLRDLKDGCEIQDWERVAQTLQRDMKDFENTLIKLNQMGEQLMGWPSPSVETVRRQLLALREQWQLLKQTASNQSKALGGLRSLQEFNRKAEQLEAWIRQKEEKPMLAALLQQSLDKIQLTRRILDLKQEEQRFHGLHEEMNTLAQRLEKQGRSESRSISARRKHLNKMWLRLQGTLKEHHETLQLALEAAAFLQQADMLLEAIHAKWRSLYGVGKQGEADPSRDQDVRDIASQVMMLDVTVSQLISLHPSLVTRITHKHRDVKESWARLQQVLRNEKSPVQSLTSSSPREALSPEQTGGSSEGVARSEAGDKEKRVPGNEVQKDVSGSVTEHVRGEEGSPGLSGGHLAEGCHSSKRRKLPGHSDAGWGAPQQESQLQDYCQAANMAVSWLKEGAGPGIQQNQVEDAENLEALQSHQKILGNSTGLEAVCQEGQKLLHACPRGSPEVEGVLRELAGLWEELQRKHQENGAVLREIDKALRLVGELDRAEHWLQGVAGSLSEPAAMKNPEELRRDLQDIGSLENQLLLWGIRLQALREEMGREPSMGHEAAGRIQRKVETVEEKLRCVRAALRRRASDLRDSLVLSEFLQNVQQEEVLSQKSCVQPVTHQLDPKEPLHPLLVQAGQQLNRAGMTSPLGELQEAVEMLNDAVKERERVMEAAAETESLEHLLAEVSLHMQAVRCRAEALAHDIAQAERGFATVKSEWDLQGLQGLLSRQQDMEREMSEALEGHLKELQRAASRLEKLCTTQRHDLVPEVQETLKAGEGLLALVLENKARMEQAGQLRQFFRDYLAMISWTEDTRAQIFSENLSTNGLLEAQCEELERKIEDKFMEFEKLAAAGQKLVSEEHDLSETIQERMEELQSMLGWVLVRWRAQKHQLDPGSKSDGGKGQDSPLDSTQHAFPGSQDRHAPSVLPDAKRLLGPNASKGPQPSSCSFLEPLTPPQDLKAQPQRQEKEVVPPSVLPIPRRELSWEGPGDSTPLEIGIPKETLVDPSKTPVVVVPPQGTSSVGGTVSLILSIGKKRDKRLQLAQAGAEQGEEALHKVSTYLCVKENEGVGSATHKSSTMPRPAKQAPARSHASLVSSTGADTTFHTLPKASSSSLVDSLQGGRKAVVEGAQLPWQQRLLTAEPSQLQPWLEEKHNPSSTWPLKCERRKMAEKASSPKLRELGEGPPERASNAECSTIRAASSGPKAEVLSQGMGPSSSQPVSSKGTCRHLSLGSVLSLELPKDLGLLRNVQDSIKIAERKKGQQPCGVIQWEVKGPEQEVNGASLSKEVLSHQLTTCPRPGGSMEPSRKALKSEHDTWFEEVSFNPGYDRQKTQSVAAAPSREDGQSPQGQSSSSNDFLDSQVHQLSRISMLREQAGWEWNQLKAMLEKPGSPGRVQPEKPVDLKPQLQEATRVELRPSPTKLSSGALARGEPPQGSGKLKECKLETAPMSKASEESPVRLPGGGTDPFPLINLGLRATPQLSVLEYDISYPQQSLALASTGPQDLASAGHMMGLGLSKEAKPPGSVEVCHPDHELFEEDEEELQAIWSSVEGHSRQIPRADPSMCPTMGNGSDEVQNPDVSNRKLILTSENNVLVAKFTLPASAQQLCNPQTGRGTSKGHKTEGSPSGFWASLPSQEGLHGVKEVVALGSVEGTGPQNRQKHQEEDRDLGKTPPSKREFQMMEGALERKHVLQTGGKKANCRTWSLFHTVLMRQTLCFYQDRKDTLKSSVVALPLNLSGARCTQDMEYTKKTNCFRLQLRDGSEYLLRAPSQPLMNEWVSKLQQNSGFPELDYFQAAVQPAEGTSSPISSHLQGHHQPVTAKSQEITLLPRSSARMHLPFGNREDLQDSAALLAGDSQRANSQMTGHRRFQWSPTGSPRSQDANCQEEDYALVTNKRRSYSFTSATYQKITPVSVPKEPLEPGSSYSITLYIGEQAVPRARCHSFVAMPGSPRNVLVERGQGTPPRPKNKSVFKKFFGKKE